MQSISLPTKIWFCSIIWIDVLYIKKMYFFLSFISYLQFYSLYLNFLTLMFAKLKRHRQILHHQLPYISTTIASVAVTLLLVIHKSSWQYDKEQQVIIFSRISTLHKSGIYLWYVFYTVICFTTEHNCVFFIHLKIMFKVGLDCTGTLIIMYFNNELIFNGFFIVRVLNYPHFTYTFT